MCSLQLPEGAQAQMDAVIDSRSARQRTQGFCDFCASRGNENLFCGEREKPV